MWKLGLWTRNSFSGNICFEFSVLVLCSELQFSISILLAVYGHSRGILQKVHNSKTVALKRTDRVLHNMGAKAGGEEGRVTVLSRPRRACSMG
jgi:nitrate reductase gamma subunit